MDNANLGKGFFNFERVWITRDFFFPQDIDECTSSPCLNNGTCVDRPNGFECACTSLFRGDICEAGKLWVKGHTKMLLFLDYPHPNHHLYIESRENWCRPIK